MTTWWRERNMTPAAQDLQPGSSVDQLFAAQVREYLRGQQVVDFMNYLRTTH